MIEVELRGRLGNCLFQYAAGRALALRHRTRLVLRAGTRSDRTRHSGADMVGILRLLRLQADVSRGEGCRSFLARLRLRRRPDELTESQWGYDPAFEHLGTDARLRGYFQSARYWSAFARELRSEIALRSTPDSPEFRRVLAAIGDANAVSVHVRRTDYGQSALHDVCTAAYYESAIAEMRRRLDSPAFFVFSDDLGWCRWFASPDTMLVELPPGLATPVHELVLMSRCRHHVIANSSFSWWGAWLDARPDTVVLAPDRWFNDEAMNARAVRDTLQPEWIRWPHDGAGSARLPT